MSSITKVVFVAILSLGIFAQLGFSASTTGLADWCFNVNGNFNASNGCNGGSGAALGNPPFNISGWDKTLEPGTNNLGSVAIQLTAGQFAVAYMDYDLDFQTTGAFQDVGSAHGVPVPGVMSYELNDPNTSNIFGDFSSYSLVSPLPDSNGVGTGSAPPNPCCDVSWALAYNALLSGTITFTVSTSAPTSGFYLQQTNFDDGNSIYLSESFTPLGGPPPTTPEPATFLLVVPALGGIYLWNRRRSVSVPNNK